MLDWRIRRHSAASRVPSRSCAALLVCLLLSACAAPPPHGTPIKPSRTVPAAPSTRPSARLATSAPTTQPATLAERLDLILGRRSDTGATYVARVLRWPGREELYAHDIDRPVMPASNMKVLTSAAALDILGPEHELKTYLALDGDNLWIIGTGDPALGDPRLAKKAGRPITAVFDDWAAALQARGVREISGDLVYDDAALDDQRVHATWGDSVLYWYGAPIGGLNFNDNCIDVTVSPGAADQSATFTVVPAPPCIQVMNACLTAARHEPSLEKEPGRNVYRLGGTCAQREELKSSPVEDPGAFTADVLRTQLAQHGITIAGPTRRASAPLGDVLPPPADKLIATHVTPIPAVLGRVNTNSQNMMAEALCKLAGQAHAAREGRRVPGSWADGGAAIHAFLRRNGIPDQHVVVADGSGLSRDNRVTARVMTEIFALMKTRPDGGVFFDSLAQGGVSGTIEKRFKGYEGRVFAKTGQIEGVRALSGYVKTNAGEWVIFSIIYNGIIGSVDPFEELQDEAVRLLMEQ